MAKDVMKRLVCDTVQGVVGHPTPGQVSIQFSDPSGHWWEVSMEKLELVAFHAALGQAIENEGVTPHAVLSEARKKYQHLFEFPDS